MLKSFTFFIFVPKTPSKGFCIDASYKVTNTSFICFFIHSFIHKEEIVLG